MEYALPPQLSKQFSISLKTVYNYLSKHSEKIRTRKEYWKTLVHFEDFTKFIQEKNQIYKVVSEEKEKVKSPTLFWKENEALSKVQKDYKIVLQEKENLEKYNLNLQDQVTKYALMLQEEKAEKKEVLNKFESLQNQYNDRLETFWKERVRFTKKYYTLLTICIMTLIILGYVVVQALIKLPA